MKRLNDLPGRHIVDAIHEPLPGASSSDRAYIPCASQDPCIRTYPLAWPFQALFHTPRASKLAPANKPSRTRKALSFASERPALSHVFALVGVVGLSASSLRRCLRYACLSSSVSGNHHAQNRSRISFSRFSVSSIRVSRNPVSRTSLMLPRLVRPVRSTADAWLLRLHINSCARWEGPAPGTLPRGSLSLPGRRAD